jgi:5'-3' exonuclease
MALHITFNSIKKAWQDFGGKHVVFCLEGRSWRKDYYKPYKANRAETRSAMTVKEQEEDKLFWETFDAFKEFVETKTNCTVLQHKQLEADDLIAGFIQSHPNDDHVIISTDSDFHQLLAPNVKQYNGVSEETHTLEGIFDKKGKLVIDKKTKEPKAVPNPEWLLFEKCIRGDSSDNVFSAYPGVRVKGTKNKVGLLEAYEDKDKKGWAWNNLMLQRWSDHEGKEHRVLDDYNRNRQLIDLNAQPEDIKQIIQETIATNAVEKNISQVGIRLLKFCQLYDMKRMIDSIQLYAEPFQAKYTK